MHLVDWLYLADFLLLAGGVFAVCVEGGREVKRIEREAHRKVELAEREAERNGA